MSKLQATVKEERGWLDPMRPRFGEQEETCRRCGQPVAVVWQSSDELWRAVRGDPGGILCIRCFDEDAEAKGIYLAWVPVAYTALPDDPPLPLRTRTAGECPVCGRYRGNLRRHLLSHEEFR